VYSETKCWASLAGDSISLFFQITRIPQLTFWVF